MRNLVTYLAAVFIPVAMWAQSGGQTIFLRDGSQITGTIVNSGGRDITIRDRDGNLRHVDSDRVQSIDYGTGRDRGRDRDGRDQNNDRFDRGDRRSVQERDRLDIRNPMTVPAGTEVGIRTNESIDSRDASEARSYSAQVDRDLVGPNGNVLIPRGSEASLIVRRVGNSQLALDLQSVAVDGQTYSVDTESVSRGKEGIGGNKRTGEYVGGGAALGAIIGAIAGGGKGAGIGAIAGGAAGAGAQVLTRGDHVSVPAETTLTFRLDAPIYLNPIR